MALSHRDYCLSTTAWLLKQSWCDVACFELSYNNGFVDVIGLSKTNARRHRVTVIEVKRSRADLLQDINARKYKKYEPGSTHCYLAGTKEALGLHKKSRKQVMLDLRDRGFPNNWGILILGSRGGVTTLRNAKAINKTTIARIQTLTRQIARSFCYRAIKGKR